jgi:hypothetical protein
MGGKQRGRTEEADTKRYQSLKDKKGNDKRADWSGSPELEIHRNTSRDKIAATQLPRTEAAKASLERLA